MSLKMLILAIVEAKPATGYEITKEFDAVAGYFWRASHQQVYRELATLTEDGWLRFREVSQQARPDKKIYAITAAGRRAFAKWFSQPQDIPRINDPLMVKMFAGEFGGVDTLLNQIAAERASRTARLVMLESVEREHYAEDVADMPRWKQLVYQIMRWGMARERAWLHWATETETLLGPRRDSRKGAPS